MKKILVLALTGAAALFAKHKLDEGKNEQDLWREATDPVRKA
ncbi:DLW-39 family protein [Nocardioides aurantiacus]|uniref:Uncharacterized protein n=1 Tax=Nocardioides aurantiacus TaxID=86796 RepID=A0A3N2CZH6_9ACTN|nr:DLW-39 family protein [Nocardioides aurantiacus]ROR92941.1 hypothetical protein EDD33_3844 [Nocardioides aurantiacus]